MNLPVVLSKRHKRDRSIKDCEPGLPYTEVIIEGKRVDLCENIIGNKKRNMVRISFSNDLLHSKILRRHPNIVKIYSKYLINLPTTISEESKIENIENISVDNLIIGGDTSALGILSELSKNEKTVMISFKVLNNIEIEKALIPQIQKEKFLKTLKDIINENEGKILKGVLLGKFDEGIGFLAGNKILLIRPKRTFLATGGRYIPPIFKGNDTPGIISKNLYMKLSEKFNHVIAIGNSDDAVKPLFNVKGKRILITNGVLFFSKYYKELIDENGIEIIKIKNLEVKRKKDKIITIADWYHFYSDVIVYAVIKQPKIDHASNLGIYYTFNTYFHIYMPYHTIEGKSEEDMYIAGGMRGISDEYTSFLSGKAAVNIRYIDELISNMKDYTYIFEFYYNSDRRENPSPYLYGEDGYVCECEDIKLNEIKSQLKRGFNKVEEIKRTTGLGTGECQGKFCTYMIGSLIRDNELITFRSPLYRLVV